MKDQLLNYHQREYRRDSQLAQTDTVIDLTQQAQANTSTASQSDARLETTSR